MRKMTWGALSTSPFEGMYAIADMASTIHQSL